MSTLTLSSPLEHLVKSRKKTKTIEKLNQAGIQTVHELLWILPLKTIKTPKVQSFDLIEEDELFKGQGILTGVRTSPSFQKGKGRVRLWNITANIQDKFSSHTLVLQWFNTYPNLKQKLDKLIQSEIIFMGKIGTYKEQYQIVSPDLIERDNDDNSIIIQYPTINGVSNPHLKKLFNSVPHSLFEEIEEFLSETELSERELISLPVAFKVLHGKISHQEELNKDVICQAKDRLIYEEFLNEQIKFKLRKKERNQRNAQIIDCTDLNFESFLKLFPYQLTDDQKASLQNIREDLKSGHPASRLIQGDVGSGKTTVAIVAALICLEQGYQVALMCPTEALASQHYKTIKDLLSSTNFKIGLLTGSLKPKEKAELSLKLKSGDINFVIGTHALFQDSISFHKLGLSIIDEQHKFGVNQRLKLLAKGDNTHCLLLSATPIPRSLSLTQFGDLDISIIKTMPAFKKEIKTRIVEPHNFEKFLTFINTRLNMHEQGYIVVPAIEDNPEMDFQALESVFEKFKKFFPHTRIDFLHGQMSGEAKQLVFDEFMNHEIDLLVSTSVIEVGINNLNATFMGIINPERFGLSSLHQLRGRVGRGGKPGFCFLVVDKENMNNIPRLKVIENTTDGFKIAEADLHIRGQGDLFGINQSGGVIRKIANIIEHEAILYQVCKDIDQFNDRATLKQKFAHLLEESYVLNTI